jgi:hypothetical protein
LSTLFAHAPEIAVDRSGPHRHYVAEEAGSMNLQMQEWSYGWRAAAAPEPGRVQPLQTAIRDGGALPGQDFLDMSGLGAAMAALRAFEAGPSYGVVFDAVTGQAAYIPPAASGVPGAAAAAAVSGTTSGLLPGQPFPVTDPGPPAGDAGLPGAAAASFSLDAAQAYLL